MAIFSSPPAGPLAAGLERDFCRCRLEVLHLFENFTPLLAWPGPGPELGHLGALADVLSRNSHDKGNTQPSSDKGSKKTKSS